ncbi:MAG: replication initiator protein [Arizlama microvirus]|nr:MAG: replication initiator protein [Arizlama microvirus]
MPCFRPLKGYRSSRVNPDTGKRSIVFNPRDGFVDMPVDLACGQCIGCRLERSRQWAIRCVHEASLYEKNCFITLTYNNENLPAGGSLQLKDFQDFMKRLRFRFGSGIRFFHCGEYGEQFARPHYHACIFNYDFADKQIWKDARDVKLYTSETLNDLWEHKGYCTVGDVTFESAAYVARYITKKITGDRAEAHYGNRHPEYTTMSRRPGLGKGWYERFTSDVFPCDNVVLRGKVMRPPKFYDRQFELAYPEDFATLKRIRKCNAEIMAQKEPESRLAVKEELQQLKFKQLKRGYDNDA